MQVKYLKGKKSTHCFMPFADVVSPEDFEEVLERADSRERLESLSGIYSGPELRFRKRNNTLKAVIRRVEKQNYPKGTAVVVPSWYIGYASVLIIV